MSDFPNSEFDLAEVELSQQRLHGKVHRTEIITSTSLNQQFGCELFFKCEHLQKTGAFKYRGATNAVLQLDSSITGVATHSSGNHGAALAAAAADRGLAAHIVMPENSVQTKVDAVKAYGGVIHFCEPNQQSREQLLQQLIEQGLHKVHPYDDWRIIFGQSTATAELLEDVDGLDIVVVPVGGGGLTSGACLAVQASKQDIAVIAAEPAGANDSYLSLLQSKRITDIQPDTIADGLRAIIGARNFVIMNRYLDRIILVDDAEIRDALGLVWQYTKQLIEPSSATVVAAIAKHPEVFAGKRIGLILSGGNADIKRLLAGLIPQTLAGVKTQ